MINEPEGLDRRAKAVLASETDGTISDDYAETWRMGEKVEATLIAERGPGNLIGVKGGLFIPASEFVSVHPVDGNAEDLKTVKALRRQLVEERLAAGTARSETTMARIETGEVFNQLRQRYRELADLRRQHRLAVAALEHIHAHGGTEHAPLSLLLGVGGGTVGSIAEPCNAVLTVNRRHPGCGCETPCIEEVGTHPCALRRGHSFVLGKEKHATLYGREFDTGEHVLADDEDGD
jgi:hypothetical protein